MTAVGHGDKCKSTTIVDGVSSTKTTSLMVQACSVFQHFFSTASRWEECKTAEASLTDGVCRTLSVRFEDIFDVFGSFLNYCNYWFTTKVKHFLASWTLTPFFIVSQYELSLLMKSINTTLQLMEHMHCQLADRSSQGSTIKRYWDQMERKAGHLQVQDVHYIYTCNFARFTLVIALYHRLCSQNYYKKKNCVKIFLKSSDNVHKGWSG